MRTLAIFAIVVLALCSMPTPAVAAGASLCGRGLHDLEAVDTCYPPSKVGYVERLMPVTPVRPGRPVW